MDAAFAGDEDALRAAIADGEDVDAWDAAGMTPLLLAVFRGDIDAVDLLLRAGADPNRPQKGDVTATPLWHARDDFGLHVIAALLEKAGARHGAVEGPANTSAYQEKFPVGTKVCVADASVLERFLRPSWPYHHPLDPSNLRFARSVQTVVSVGFYHGGDVLYELEGIPGQWHQDCLVEAEDRRT